IPPTRPAAYGADGGTDPVWSYGYDAGSSSGYPPTYGTSGDDPCAACADACASSGSDDSCASSDDDSCSDDGYDDSSGGDCSGGDGYDDSGSDCSSGDGYDDGGGDCSSAESSGEECSSAGSVRPPAACRARHHGSRSRSTTWLWLSAPLATLLRRRRR